MDLGLDPESRARFQGCLEAQPEALELACRPGCTMHPEFWCGLAGPHHLHECEPTLEQRRRALVWLEAFGRLDARGEEITLRSEEARMEDEVREGRGRLSRWPVAQVLPFRRGESA